MLIELEEMEASLAGLVSRIGGLNGEKPIDALARAGSLLYSFLLTEYQ